MAQTIIVGRDGSSAYSITDATRNITISGIPWTLSIEDIALIFNKTQDKLYYAPAEGLAKVSVSGGVITIDSSFAVLDDADDLHIQLFEPNRGVDQDGYPMVHVLNPEYANYTSPETLIAEEDETVDNVNRYVIPFEGFKHMSIYAKLYAGSADDSVTMTIWGTNDADADDTADTGWVDLSTLIMGAASLEAVNETEEEMYFIDTSYRCLKFMIKLEYGLSSSGITEDNSADVIIVKG